MTLDAFAFSGITGAAAIFATALLPLHHSFWSGLIALSVNLAMLLIVFFAYDITVGTEDWSRATAAGFVIGALWTMIGRILTKDVPRA